MIAEVISIGDELTSGQRLDTNSQWLSERLGELGIDVRFHTTVADDLAANVLVFHQAIARADVIVATGGLGPTADDLTRQAVAQALGVELELHEPSLAHIRGLFARHGRDMPERNSIQAMFPVGSRPIPNDHGTAPGIALEAARPQGGICRVFALPGVPAEMREMFAQSLAPAIESASVSRRVIRHRRIKCFGVGESHLEQMLPDLIRRGRQPSVGITVHAATITLRITAAGATSEECFAAMEPTVETIRKCLGTLVFGEDDDELEDAVLRLLKQRGQSLATAEWGTNGLLAHWLGEAIARDGGQFLGGVVIADAQALSAALGINVPLGNDDASSADMVQAMAGACRERFAADFALAVGPFATAEAPPDPPATYHFALATPKRVIVKSSTLASHPSIHKPRAAKQALNLLRLWILEER